MYMPHVHISVVCECVHPYFAISITINIQLYHNSTANMCTHCYHVVSGVVEEVSETVASQAGVKKGDSVMALVGGGGYAGQLL